MDLTPTAQAMLGSTADRSALSARKEFAPMQQNQARGNCLANYAIRCWSVSAPRIVAMYATAQPHNDAGPMLSGALLAPGRIVSKLGGVVPSVGCLPPPPHGEGSVQARIIHRHSVTVARTARCG